MQANRESGEFAGDLLGARSRFGIALSHQRRDYLLDQPDLAIGGRFERPKVPRFDAETRHLGNGARDHQRRTVVVIAARPNGNQAVLFELIEGCVVEFGGLEQFLA